jgi:hypothetical protein
MEVPEGMVAVPMEQLDDWAVQLAREALDLMSDQDPPDFIDLSADIALGAVCGIERAETFPDATNRLAYNLFLSGYWCRLVEMRALKLNETSPEMTNQLRLAHQRLESEDWFATLQRVAYGLAGAMGYEDDQDDMEALVADWEAALPQDAGEEFRLSYGAFSTEAICEAGKLSDPGAGDYLSPADVRFVWDAGYWMRAVSLSLPDEAHKEFREQQES